MSTTNSLKPNKVCPVLLNNKGDDLLILAFRHPFAGNQLVKGTIEINESPEAAALRELFEESGIDSAAIIKNLGIWDSGYKKQIWTIYLCEAEELPDNWIHYTQDDGGLNFTFFWHPIRQNADDNWHPLYREALQWIKTKIMPVPHLRS